MVDKEILGWRWSRKSCDPRLGQGSSFFVFGGFVFFLFSIWRWRVLAICKGAARVAKVQPRCSNGKRATDSVSKIPIDSKKIRCAAGVPNQKVFVIIGEDGNDHRALTISVGTKRQTMVSVIYFFSHLTNDLCVQSLLLTF